MSPIVTIKVITLLLFYSNPFLLILVPWKIYGLFTRLRKPKKEDNFCFIVNEVPDDWEIISL